MTFDHITILSMRRSGCHAVAQWIGSLTGVPCLYCNMGSPRATNVIQDGKMLRLTPGVTYPPDTPILVGTENPNLSEDAFGIPSTKRVFVVRDPFNWIAACLLHNNKAIVGNMKKGVAIAKWIAYAQEYAGLTNFLNATGVDFNQWCLSHDYRVKKAAELGYPDADVDYGTLYVSDHGGGSSISGTIENEFGGATADEKQERLTRWRSVITHADFQALIKVPMVWRLADEIWPNVASAVRAEIGVAC